MKYFIRTLFFLFFVIILCLRLFSDHTQNFHYTGDYLTEQQLLTAADNFEKFGLRKTRLMPIPEKLDEKTPFSTETLRPHFYTHYPPLPHWLFGGIYLLFDHSELAARILAILLSITGLIFAIKSVRVLQTLCGTTLQEGADFEGAFFIVFALLALNPAFLLFADAIQQHSLTEVLQWFSLYWSIRYLYYRASLWWGILLYFLHVWVSFEWLIPFFIVILFCITIREGHFIKAPRAWVYFLLFGFTLPIGLRLLLNAWALGGLHEALSDLLLRAKIRSLGDPSQPQMQYDLIKHFGKLFFGLLWFSGISVFLIVSFHISKLFKALRQKRWLLIFLLLWGLGSVSWQLIMPQNAMVHAYIQIHIANFFFLLAALSVALFWKERKGFFIPLTILYCVGAGSVIKSEIIFPFLSKSASHLATALCTQDKGKLEHRIRPIISSMSKKVQTELQKSNGKQECDGKSKAASKILAIYTYTIKSRLSHP